MDGMPMHVILYSDGTARTEIVARQLRRQKIRFKRIEWPWSRKKLPALETGTSRYEGLRAIQAYFLSGR